VPSSSSRGRSTVVGDRASSPSSRAPEGLQVPSRGDCVMTYARQSAWSPAAADLRPRLPADPPRDMIGRVASWLAWLVAALALAGSLPGLLIDGIYTGDASAAEMFRGFDLVTAVVVVPSLVLAVRFAREVRSGRSWPRPACSPTWFTPTRTTCSVPGSTTCT
jgi:hypothetical protein